MTRALLLTLVLGGLSTAGTAHAQSSDLLVVTIEPGPTRMNRSRLLQAVGRSTNRTVVRLTDARARDAEGRLTIAFSPPDRWVLRYEAHGQVGWTSDRIRDPRAMRARLAELSRTVVEHVERSDAARRDAAASDPRRSGRTWDDELILALQNEIVDPFADMPRREYRPIPILWSEVVDPFTDEPPRPDTRHVWSEVLDPWSGTPRGRR